MKKKILSWIITIVLVVSIMPGIAVPAYADVEGHSISGTVTLAADGSAIEDAALTLYLFDGTLTEVTTGTTGSGGSYTFTGLDDGVYIILAERSLGNYNRAAGFAPLSGADGTCDLSLPAFTDTWDNYYNDAPGLSGTTYAIDSAEDLAWITYQASVMYNTFSGYTLKLGADIDLSAHDWIPINNFSGTFDGDGHVISRVTISGLSGSCGFFAQVYGGAVQNVGLENVSITNCTKSTDEDGVGALAGYMYGGTISGCYAAGTVSYDNADGYAGGLIGYVYGDSLDPSAVSRCYADCDVSGSFKYGGGLIGNVSGDSTLTDCYAAGDVIGSSSNSAGGFAGYTWSSDFTNCYSAGNVTGAARYGGFVGYDYDSLGSFTDCYWLSGAAPTGVGSGAGTGITEVADMTTAAFLASLNGTPSSELWGNYRLINGGRPVLKGVGIGDNWIFYATGSLTETASVYTVDSAEDLAWVAYSVNNGNNFFGKTINVTADIDLSAHEWTPIGTGSDDPFSGTFNGGNSDGYEITGLYIDETHLFAAGLFGEADYATIGNTGVSVDITASYSDINYVGGIVGYSYDTDITGCVTSGTLTVNPTGSEGFGGGIAGTVTGGGSITGCGSSADVAGRSCLGGIAGSAAANITSCYATGTITASAGYCMIGGLIGYFPGNGFTISKCYATGDLTSTVGSGDICTGGLVGYIIPGFGSSLSIDNCYATGDVEYAYRGGGFAGYQLTWGTCSFTNCYGSGSVGGTGYIGGFLGGYGNGLPENTPTITACYWNSTNNPGIPAGIDEGTDTTVSKTSAQMSDTGFLTLLNGDSYWKQVSNLNNGFPILSAVGDGALATCAVTFKTDDTTIYKTSAVTKDRVFSAPAGPTKSGYTFSGWYTALTGGTKWNFSSGTASADLTLYARFTAVSSGGGSSSTPSGGTTTTTTNTSGGVTTTTMTTQAASGGNSMASANLTGGELAAAIAEAVREAREQGSGRILIEVDIDTQGHASGASLTIPKSAFDDLAGRGIDGFTVSAPFASVTFDAKALDAIASQASGDITITVQQADTSGLSEGDKAKIGGRPAYDFTVISGGATIQSFGGGTATIGIPYTPAAGENPDNIVIYYISDSGELVAVPNCRYDPATGRVIFKLKHFSTYAVGYNEVRFTDVSGWYETYVDFLAARGILAGSGDGTFSPDAHVTRAEFATILLRLSGDDTPAHTQPAFTDVAAGDWYSGAAQWAYENGIASGYNGSFSPNAGITREEMAVMLYNYAKYAGTDVSGIEGMAIREFSDYEAISDWAMTPVRWAMNAGLLSGNGDGSFAPQANATRAQAAKVTALLLQSNKN